MDQNREWVKKYVELMSNEDIEAGITLKEEYFPNSLFKYTTVSDRTIENLQNNQIWLAKIGSLNDPFECSLQFDNDAEMRLFYARKDFNENFNQKFGIKFTESELKQIISNEKPYIEFSNICSSKGITIDTSYEELLSRANDVGMEIIADMNKHIRISCFSERNDSLLMWSHYANEHKGICIEYDFNDSDHIRPFLQPIFYDNTIAKISTFDDLTIHRQMGALLTKCKDWEYEAEWRFTPIKQKGIDLPEKVNVPTPKAVYFGTRFARNELKLKSELIKVLGDMNIPIYPMKKHPTEFKLVKI